MFYIEELVKKRRKASSELTKTHHWFFVDIIASSDLSLTVQEQKNKVSTLVKAIEDSKTIKVSNLSALEILPTGDGMAIGFQDSAEKTVLLAIELHRSLHKYNKSKSKKNKINVRIGIDTGPAYFLKGVGGGKIFWGPGLIMAKRVMDLCGTDNILVSDRIGKDLRRLSKENKTSMRPIGKYNFKHGESAVIYNIYGKNFGNKNVPKRGKEIKKKESVQEQKKPKFEFNEVEIKLDVKDPKTMLTNHVWKWNLTNITDKPLNHLFYSVGGDTPKDISEMNLKITDKNKDELEILSIEKDKPIEKEFFVKLNKPLGKNQRGVYTLEYDWEEPERVFEYILPTKCKKFRYIFTMPKGVKMKNRILEIVKELGYKTRVDPPPKIRFLKNKTEITWETAKNRIINPYDSFEFQW